MKIAFIGTHGVGKTTLCCDLASRSSSTSLSEFRGRPVILAFYPAERSPLVHLVTPSAR